VRSFLVSSSAAFITLGFSNNLASSFALEFPFTASFATLMTVDVTEELADLLPAVLFTAEGLLFEFGGADIGGADII
jgi:hypothetical protein